MHRLIGIGSYLVAIFFDQALLPSSSSFSANDFNQLSASTVSRLETDLTRSAWDACFLPTSNEGIDTLCRLA